MSSRIINVTRVNFTLTRDVICDPQAMIALLTSSFYHGFLSIMPLFGMLLLACNVGPIALGGWLFSSKAMAPKLSRMDPLAGLKRMFSLKSLVELGKALGKVVVILGVTILLLLMLQQPMFRLSDESTNAAIIHSLQLSG